MGVTKRAVAWVKDDPFGVEFAEIDLSPNRLNACGVAIAGASIQVPIGLDYTLETAADFVTSRLHVVKPRRGLAPHTRALSRC